MTACSVRGPSRWLRSSTARQAGGGGGTGGRTVFTVGASAVNRDSLGLMASAEETQREVLVGRNDRNDRWLFGAMVYS